MKHISVIFFGSTSDSVLVLEKLSAVNRELITISAVVTQPPRPIGRKQEITPTPVEIWAKSHAITSLSFPNDGKKPWLYADENTVIDALEPIGADLIVSASYGQKIPNKTLSDAKFGGLNVHPSILPRWRGGDPVPWAIVTGDHQVGVTVVSLSDKFDEGLIFAQKKIPVTPKDTSDPLRTKLFAFGADLLVKLLPEYIEGKAKGRPQNGKDEPRAKRLTRDLGFEPWEMIAKAFVDNDEAARIDRKFRALIPWPGVWTRVALDTPKRLKILAMHVNNGKLVIDQVQLEGKNPVSWMQFSKAYQLG